MGDFISRLINNADITWVSEIVTHSLIKYHRIIAQFLLTYVFQLFAILVLLLSGFSQATFLNLPASTIHG